MLARPLMVKLLGYVSARRHQCYCFLSKRLASTTGRFPPALFLVVYPPYHLTVPLHSETDVWKTFGDPSNTGFSLLYSRDNWS